MDRDIIDRVLNRVATPEEARMVAKWLETDEGQAYLSVRLEREAAVMDEELLQEWSYSDIPNERLRWRAGGSIKSKRHGRKYQVILAALIPILLLGGSLLYLLFKVGFFGAEVVEVKVPYGEVAQVVLQDGTSIKLNAESTLSYAKNFSLFSREVSLDGEGYFEVAPEGGRPFTIDLDGVVVKVTGTSFNLKAYSGGDVVVWLDEGSVELIDEDKRAHALKEGDVAVYNREARECVIGKRDEVAPVAEWAEHRLSFYRAPLGEILDTLSRQYNVQFVAENDTLLDVRFSIVSDAEELLEVLGELEAISQIKFEAVEDNHYIVRDVRK